MGSPTLQSFDPFAKMGTLLPHFLDTDGACRKSSINNLAICWMGIEHSFGGGRIGIVIDVLRRWERISYALELLGEMRLANSTGKSSRVTEQQSLIFVKLEIRQE